MPTSIDLEEIGSTLLASAPGSNHDWEALLENYMQTLPNSLRGVLYKHPALTPKEKKKRKAKRKQVKKSRKINRR